MKTPKPSRSLRSQSFSRLAALLVSAASLLACGGGAAGGKAGSGESVSAAGERGPSSSASASGATREVSFGSEEPRAVTLVEFLDAGLALGFSDGAVAIFDPSSKAAKESKVAKVHSVAAVSPSGNLALLASNPPAIVNFEGELILQMNTVQSFESAAFGRQSLALYVADEEGKVRIWGEAHSFEEDQHKEKLENYLNRQAPDFHVEFAPIRGPIAVTPANQVVVVDQDGIVRLWDPTRPSNSQRIMKIDGNARSIAAAENFLYVTSTHGALKIGKTDGSGYLPWTKDARGGYVAANGLATETYWQLDDGLVAHRNAQDGSPRWEVKLPSGPLCGLSVSSDASMLAACVGNRVVLLDAKSGQAHGYMFRGNDRFTWESY